jgi:hypothetical protein
MGCERLTKIVSSYKNLQSGLDLLDRQWRQSNKRNVVKFGEGETLEHVLLKAEACWRLKKLKKQFYTEAVFKNNVGRADIFVINPTTAVEIVCSESEESIENKKLKYNCDLIVIKSKKDFEKVERILC